MIVIQIVVMACKVVEMAKPKCERYWPEVNQSMKIGAIQVTTVSGGRREWEGREKWRDGGEGGGRERGRREGERGGGGEGEESFQPLLISSSFSLQLNEQNISNDFVVRDFMAECQGVSQARLN
jgi:hypothetical protein